MSVADATSITVGGSATPDNNLKIISNDNGTFTIQTAGGARTIATIDGSGNITSANSISGVGSVVQTVFALNATSATYTNQDVATFNFQVAITPKFTNSIFVATAIVNGLDNGANGRLMSQIIYNTTSGGTTGSVLCLSQVASNQTGIIGLMSASMSGLTGATGNLTTLYFKVVNTKLDANTQWFIQRNNTTSTIVVQEIKQ